MLSDMGADVIKVEERISGEFGRRIIVDSETAEGFHGYWEAHNRNKRSITLDLTKPEAQKIVNALASKADVLVENFRRGVMDRLGFSYKALSALNPRLIYASASGFGQKGPWSQRPAYDYVAQAVGGIMVAQASGSEGEPQFVRVAVADQVGSMVFAYGIMLALFAREKTGVGQEVHASLLGGQIALQAWYITSQMYYGKFGVSYSLERAPTFCKKTGDGKWIALHPPTALQVDWDGFLKAVDCEELYDDPRFATPEDRLNNQAQLEQLLQKVFLGRSREEWLARFAEAGIPCSPVYNYTELADSPQAIENGYVVPMQHPVYGLIRVTGVPIQLSKTPGKVRRPAPAVGEHSEEILSELGYSRQDVERLRVKAVI